MSIIITLPHASWWPHRSGYETRRPSYPEEYGFARMVSELLRCDLAEHGVHVDIIEKSRRYKCEDECGGRGNNCGRYISGLVDVTKQVKRAKPELAIEFHLNNSPAGSHGAFCITTGTSLADQWATSWLRRWTLRTPIEQYGSGVYGPRAFGKKHYLEEGAKNAVIVEVGHASSATDAEFLQTTQAIRHCVLAASAATREVISGNELASDS